MNDDDKFGVVQDLAVEADTKAALRCALTIAAQEHRGASHYRVTDNGKDGTALWLLWGNDEAPGCLPLPFELKGGEEMAEFAWNWLHKAARYPAEYPDTDGSVKNGFRVTHDYSYVTARVAPTFIVYGK
jgi:hypothetical protein